jgi:hypothetical protein
VLYFPAEVASAIGTGTTNRKGHWRWYHQAALLSCQYCKGHWYRYHQAAARAIGTGTTELLQGSLVLAPLSCCKGHWYLYHRARKGYWYWYHQAAARVIGYWYHPAAKVIGTGATKYWYHPASC